MSRFSNSPRSASSAGVRHIGQGTSASMPKPRPSWGTEQTAEGHNGSGQESSRTRFPMQIVMRRVEELESHPCLRFVPMLPADDANNIAIVRDIAARGVMEPLQVTPSGLVADGRHRLRGALMAQLEEVPCITIPEEQAVEIALRTLLLRRHLSSKGAMAYVGFTLVRDLYRQVAELNQSLLNRGTVKSTVDVPATAEELAEQLGVSSRTFLQAAKIHSLFEQDPTLREEWEPNILDSEDPVGLGAVIAGIGGARASRGVTPVRNSAFHRWITAWRGMPKAAASWSKWKDEQKDEAVKVLTDSFTHLPDHMLDAMSGALRAARRARNAGRTEE